MAPSKVTIRNVKVVRVRFRQQHPRRPRVDSGAGGSYVVIRKKK